MLVTDLPRLWSNILKPTSPLPPYDLRDGGCLGWALLCVSMPLGLPSRKLKRSFQKLKRNSQWQKPKSGWQSKSALSSCSLTQTTPGDRDSGRGHALCQRHPQLTPRSVLSSLAQPLALSHSFPQETVLPLLPCPKSPRSSWRAALRGKCHLQRWTLCSLWCAGSWAQAAHPALALLPQAQHQCSPQPNVTLMTEMHHSKHTQGPEISLFLNTYLGFF